MKRPWPPRRLPLTTFEVRVIMTVIALRLLLVVRLRNALPTRVDDLRAPVPGSSTASYATADVAVVPKGTDTGRTRPGPGADRILTRDGLFPGWGMVYGV
jgi:hypothetical protein